MASTRKSGSAKAPDVSAFRPLQFVFLMGRPGAGKSEFFNSSQKLLLEQHGGMRCVRLDDVRRLREMAAGMHDGHRYLQPTTRGGFTVKDPAVFGMVLDALNDQALAVAAKGASACGKLVVLVEFARANIVESLRKHFSPAVLERALVLYLEVPVSKSIERTQRRVTEACRTISQDHHVPPGVIEQVYASDDRDALVGGSPAGVKAGVAAELGADAHGMRTVLIDNSEDDIELFRKRVAHVLARVVANRLDDDDDDRDALATLARLRERDAEAAAADAARKARTMAFMDDRAVLGDAAPAAAAPAAAGDAKDKDKGGDS